MLWPMPHTNFSKRMVLFGSQVPLSQLLIVKVQENSSVLLLWYISVAIVYLQKQLAINLHCWIIYWFR